MRHLSTSLTLTFYPSLPLSPHAYPSDHFVQASWSLSHRKGEILAPQRDSHPRPRLLVPYTGRPPIGDHLGRHRPRVRLSHWKQTTSIAQSLIGLLTAQEQSYALS